MGIGQWGYNGDIDIENKQWGCLRLGTHEAFINTIGWNAVHPSFLMGGTTDHECSFCVKPIQFFWGINGSMIRSRDSGIGLNPAFSS